MCDHPAANDLALFVHGELDGAPRARLEAHLAECTACAARLADEARLELALFEVARAPAGTARRPRMRVAMRTAAAAAAALALLVMVHRDGAPAVVTSARAIPAVTCAPGEARASCIERAYRHGLFVQSPRGAPPLRGPASSPFPPIHDEDL